METKPTEKPLTFKPLSEGLGFHPFSDGLPYAPVTKSSTSSSANSKSFVAPKPRTNPLPVGPMPDFHRGSGAVSAGPSSFNSPAGAYQPAAPRISVPVASLTQSSNLGLAQVRALSQAQNQAQAQAMVQTQARGQAKAQAQSKASSAQMSAEFRAELAPSYGFGYLAKRSIAYILDTLFNTGLCASTFAFALWKQEINPETLVGPSMIFLFAMFLFTFNWAIMAAQEMAFGTTLGKRIFGLALDGSAAAIFLRAFFFLPSAGFCAVGLVWGLFDPRKRCWHDLVVNLQPIEIAQL